MDVMAPSAASAVDVRDLGSSWAKRLGIPTRRPAWWLTARLPQRSQQPTLTLPRRQAGGMSAPQAESTRQGARHQNQAG